MKIAKETLLVFAPLAKLLGMYKIKNELEDLWFDAYPNECADIKRDDHDELSKQQEDLCKKRR